MSEVNCKTYILEQLYTLLMNLRHYTLRFALFHLVIQPFAWIRFRFQLFTADIHWIKIDSVGLIYSEDLKHNKYKQNTDDGKDNRNATRPPTAIQFFTHALYIYGLQTKTVYVTYVHTENALTDKFDYNFKNLVSS